MKIASCVAGYPSEPYHYVIGFTGCGRLASLTLLRGDIGKDRKDIDSSKRRRKEGNQAKKTFLLKQFIVYQLVGSVGSAVYDYCWTLVIFVDCCFFPCTFYVRALIIAEEEEYITRQEE